MWGLSPSVRGNRARMMYRDQYERCIPTRARSPVAVRQLMCSKPKPRWDVHLPEVGDRAGSLAGGIRPLIAGPCGSGA